MNPLPKRKIGFYEKYIKRCLDIICCILTLILLWWLYLIIAIMVKIKLGSPIIFKQPRPGIVGSDGQEKIFVLYKFRTMIDKKDSDGKLLPDEIRLTKFGKALRNTSLDELPEIFNILKGDMSIIGPRPQLVRDMVFMSDEQRMRHTTRPGLSGLAQINGRNAITWNEKFKWDLKYIKKIKFSSDLHIIFITIKKVFGKGKLAETAEEKKLNLDYGDTLLKFGVISQDVYEKKQQLAKKILKKKGM